jgi:hypothetical protein
VAEGTCPIPDGADDAADLFVSATASVGGNELAVGSDFAITDSTGDFAVAVQILDAVQGAPGTGDEVVVEALCEDYNGSVVGSITATFQVTAQASCPAEAPTSTGELTQEASVTFFDEFAEFPGADGGIERIEAEGLDAGSTASLCLYSETSSGSEGGSGSEPDGGTPVSPAWIPITGGSGDIVGAAIADGAGAIDLLSVPTLDGEVTYALLGTDAQGEPFAWTTRTTVTFPDLPQTGGGGPEAESAPDADSVDDPGSTLPNAGGGSVTGLALAGAALVLLGAAAVAVAGRPQRGMAG